MLSIERIQGAMDVLCEGKTAKEIGYNKKEKRDPQEEGH